MRKRAAETVWLLVLVTLPFQLRTVLGGWQGEWQSFFVYGTDILLVVAALLTPRLRSVFQTLPGHRLLLALLGWSAATVFWAPMVPLALFRWLFFLKGVLIVVLAAYWFQRAPRMSLRAFGLGAFLQAAIGGLQFLAQRDLGLRLLGETILHPAMDGVATITVAGQTFLRAYGTLPHPNILGAICFLGTIAWALSTRSTSGFSCLVRDYGILGVLVIGVVVSFSRLALVATGGAALLLLLWSLWRRRVSVMTVVVVIVTIVVLLTVLWPLWSVRLVPSADEQAVSLRSFYADKALAMIQERPIRGVGIGQSVPLLEQALHSRESWLLQPVHSIYLLLTVELGLVGLAIFVAFLVAVVHAVWHRWHDLSDDRRWMVVGLSITLLALLGIGAFDHFLITIQQGILLLWLVIGGVIGVSQTDGREESAIV